MFIRVPVETAPPLAEKDLGLDNYSFRERLTLAWGKALNVDKLSVVPLRSPGVGKVHLQSERKRRGMSIQISFICSYITKNDII